MKKAWLLAAAILCVTSPAFARDWLWKKDWTGTLAANANNFITVNPTPKYGLIFAGVGADAGAVHCLLKKVLGRDPDGTPDLNTLSPSNPSLGKSDLDKCKVLYTPQTGEELVLVVTNFTDHNVLASIAWGQTK